MTLLVGDCREQMAKLPARSVQAAVTSPPFWGLRDYGIPPVRWADGSEAVLGLEASPDQYIAHLVEVFQGVRRVLRDDGVLFVNLGDSYAGSGRGGSDRYVEGKKTGELLNMPHRVAEALSADGWFWRSSVIWHKRSPMPESLSGYRWVRHRLKIAASTRHPGKKWGTESIEARMQPAVGAGLTRAAQDGRVDAKAKYSDCPGCEKCRSSDGYILRRGKWRPTTAHEYIFMFSKSERYFCDGDAVAELVVGNTHDRGTKRRPPKETANHIDGNGHKDWCQYAGDKVETRNPRSVLTLSSEPYKKAHFATFPSRLPKYCIEAATSKVGCCPSCGACYAPVVESKRVPTRPGIDNKIWKHAEADDISQRTSTSPNLDPCRHIVIKEVLAHRPTCGCNAGDPVPCVVLDPFGGSGTTAQAAKWLGRDWVVCEIKPDYAVLALERIEKPPKWALPKKPKRQRRRFESFGMFQGVLFQ